MKLKKILSGVLSLALCLGAVLVSGGVAADTADISLKQNSKLMISDDGYLYRIRLGSSVADLEAEFEGDITVKDGDTVLTDAGIKSGYTVTAGDTTLTCAVTGDVNGDGKLNLADVAAAMRYFARWNPVIHVPAIDANLDERYNLADASLLMKWIAQWDVFIGTFDVEYSEDKVPAPHEDDSLVLSVADNMQKIDRRDTDIGASATIRMQLAKNEIESCQIYLASATGHEGLTVTYTDFANGIGGVIETEMTMHHYVSTESVEDPSVKVQYPDAMVPLAKFDIDKDYSQGFLLKIKAPAEAEPGLYMSKVTVRDSTGKAVKIAYVYAEVWDMTLPESSSCATAFGLSRYTIYTTHNLPQGDDSQLYVNYYEYMLENRISAYHLPYEFSDPRFEDYMNDPRVTAFCVDGCQSPFAQLTDEELSSLYEKYGDNENWNKKAYYYYVDEPNGEEAIAKLRAASERLERLFPGARHVTPIVTNPWYGEKDQVQVVEELTNLWCPISSFYTPYEKSIDQSFLSDAHARSLGKESIDKYGSAEERFSAYKAAGDELWWYVCVIPQDPYANFFTNYQGEWSRVLFWQQFLYDIDGCLYWSVNYWKSGAEWRTSDNDFYSGDGLLLYSGYRFGIDGPIGSIRMEYIRDGIEDFEYLTMVEELYGRDAALEVLSSVTTGVLDYTSEAEVIEAAKVELAEMIMAK